MILKDIIKKDFLAAYKAKEMKKKNFLGLIKGAIETEEGKAILPSDEVVLAIIKSLEKGLKTTIDAKEKLGQDVSSEKEELSWLEPYKPTLMPEDEVRTIIKEILSRENASTNHGFLMGRFHKEQNGKAFDASMVIKIIREETV